MMPHAVLYVQGKEDRWRNPETSVPDVALATFLLMILNKLLSVMDCVLVTPPNPYAEALTAMWGW